jgi:hypothetical protein
MSLRSRLSTSTVARSSRRDARPIVYGAAVPENATLGFQMKILAFLIAALIACASPLAVACKPSTRAPLIPLTDEQKFSRADLVVVATVIEMKESRDVAREINSPNAYRVTVRVEAWLKGSGAEVLTLLDTTGTDCDSSLGVSHIAMERDPRSSRWRIFIGNRGGRLWIDTADSLK